MWSCTSSSILIVGTKVVFWIPSVLNGWPKLFAFSFVSNSTLNLVGFWSAVSFCTITCSTATSPKKIWPDGWTKSFTTALYFSIDSPTLITYECVW